MGPAVAPAPPPQLPVESEFLGSTISEELVPGGSRLGVTSANLLQVSWVGWLRDGPRAPGCAQCRLCSCRVCCCVPARRLHRSPIPLPLVLPGQYVYLVADWHLNKRLGTAAAAFGRGLSQVGVWHGVCSLNAVHVVCLPCCLHATLSPIN